MLKTCSLLGLTLLSLAATNEQAKIERAALDYAEAYYEVRPDYVERSIHQDLVKLGYQLQADGSYETHPMDYDGFMGLVEYFKTNNAVPAPGAKDVEVLDTLDQTALVKLTGSWGIDYMQLAKFEGQWMTRHVLWQSPPKPLSKEQLANETELVRKAVSNYVEAIYQAKPEWMERSVDQELTKYGFWREGEATEYTPMSMSFDQLVEGASNWYSETPASESARRKIEVFDVMDKIACAKLTADWGIDYVHLAKLDGRWMIVQVIWQSHPAKRPEPVKSGASE